MISFILLLIAFNCKAFGLQFAQDIDALVIATALEIVAECVIVPIIMAIKSNKE